MNLSKQVRVNLSEIGNAMLMVLLFIGLLSILKLIPIGGVVGRYAYLLPAMGAVFYFIKYLYHLRKAAIESQNKYLLKAWRLYLIGYLLAALLIPLGFQFLPKFFLGKIPFSSLFQITEIIQRIAAGDFAIVLIIPLLTLIPAGVLLYANKNLHSFMWSYMCQAKLDDTNVELIEGPFLIEVAHILQVIPVVNFVGFILYLVGQGITSSAMKDEFSVK